MEILEKVAQCVFKNTADKPKSTEVVESLLKAEKQGKKSSIIPSYDQLIGKWRLGFITGTKKARSRAGIVLGAGKYLPRWIKISIAYTPDNRVENTVQFGGLTLIVKGLVKFFPEKRILMFDFTRIAIKLGNISVYSGYIREGQQREASFLETPLKKQAFFTYFLIQENLIAARGKGGGLAIWFRDGNL